MKELENIYQMYGDVITEKEKQGFVPALYLKNASRLHFVTVNSINVAHGINPGDLEFVKVGEYKNPGSETAYTTYVLFAKDEEQALDVFRRRNSFVRALSHRTGSGSIPNLVGIDAKGNIRPDTYLPGFNVYGLKESELDEVVSIVESGMKTFNRGIVEGRMMEEDSAHIYFSTRTKLVSTSDITRMRKKMLNTVCQYFTKYYGVERLDDRGGNNQDNILSYLTDLNKKRFLAESVLEYAENDSVLSTVNRNGNEVKQQYEQQSRV